MIGFRPNEKNTMKSAFKSEKPAADPIKEVPSNKPGIEISTPVPSSVPSLEPDTVRSNPSPEIIAVPTETPILDPSPEIPPILPMEIH